MELGGEEETAEERNRQGRMMFTKCAACVTFLLVLQFLVTFAQDQGPGLDSDDVPRSRSVDMRVQFQLEEGQPSGSFVGKIPTKPNFTYRFNDNMRYFTLNGTSGVIRTSVTLDRETLENDRFDLVILSSQPTYPIEVRITIIDINDNAPVFPEPSISVSFSESASAGTRILLDTATDGDIGDNDVTTDYKVVSGNDDNKFRLVVTTNPSGETPYLHLETTGKLDREAVQNYQLNISAQDGGSITHFGHLLVKIAILDVNDNPPIFDHSDYTVSLNESVPTGTFVLTVRATDIDDGDNSRITYYVDETQEQFFVDPETGVISTVELLNCQKNCQYLKDCQKSCVFTVFARDHGSPRQDGRTYVTVNLLDTNDHDPTIQFRYFPVNAEFATVDENAQNGSVVAAVSVIDFDEGPNSDTLVQIKGGNEHNHFRLDSNPSFDIVRVNGILDRERFSKYNLTIQATDNGSPPRTSTAFLIIHVNDINDHEPVFQRSEYSAVLSELVPVDTYVASITASDEDTGINSNIYYAIVSGDDHQWFDIDTISGLVTTKKMLDREVQGMIELKLSARDGGPNPKWAYAILKVNLLDENDQEPTFQHEVQNVTITENSPSGTLVAMAVAIDDDNGNNGSVIYSFGRRVDVDYPGIFSIDKTFGQITTKFRLDREKTPFYQLTVVARDQGNPPLSSTSTINLIVADLNDNIPEFYPVNYFASVKENAKIGTEVLRVMATDLDEEDEDKITYSLQGGSKGKFSVDEKTGAIRTSGILNRGNQAQYQLRVTANDAENKQARKPAEITIIVEDNQFEKITFVQSLGYRFSIEEDTNAVYGGVGNQVGRVVVSEKDINYGLKYAIESGDPNGYFQITSNSGIITKTKKVDRETTPRFDMVVVAYNQRSYGKINLTIDVIDINDNAPQFHDSHETVLVLENWPVGHEVHLTSAIDIDDGINSLIEYSLRRNPRDMFTINKTTGMVYLAKPLLSNSKHVFDLEVLAQDSAIPPLSGRLHLTVRVLDVNDHTPVFEHSSYETSLLESTPVNERFFALSATDADQGENSFIRYEITDGNVDQKFGVFPDGYLYVRRPLDREERGYYSVNVVAKDSGLESRSSSVSVVIHVVDENDNAPQFTNSSFTFYITENEPPDSYVGRLSAEDIDRGRNAELTFSVSTNQDDFTVDPRSGYIKTLRFFDREKIVETSGQNFFVMSAVVIDGGLTRLKNEAKVTVFVTDVNDNAPVFVRLPYNAVISEGAPVKTQVIRISASDKDDGLNGVIAYSIISGNNEEHFYIDSTSGQLLVNKKLDRETTDRYSLVVMAKDGGKSISLSSNTTVVIEVSDENDNAPEMFSPSSKVEIAETAPVGHFVARFQAKDADLGPNRQLTYSVSNGNHHEAFKMDPIQGVLTLNKRLDYEEKDVYHLNITATDSGSPRLSTIIPFTVVVKDVNDHAPRFPNTAIVRQVQEGIPLNSPIVTVTAVDPDSGVNGKIRFSIIKQEPEGDHFGIRPLTGLVFSKKDIDREFSDTFKLTVLATDLAEDYTKRLSTEKVVTLIVEDVNDNDPTFVSVDAGVLNPGAQKGASIMYIKAEDLDTNSNGIVTYSILRGNNGAIFSIDRDSGLVRLAVSQITPSVLFRFSVRAADSAISSRKRSSDTTVTVITRSSPPIGFTFKRQQYSAYVFENKPIGTSIVTVSASGASSIEYYITSVKSSRDGSEQAKVFAIDRKSGNVTTNQIIDREFGVVEYTVTIYAVDASSSVPSATSAQVSTL